MSRLSDQQTAEILQTFAANARREAPLAPFTSARIGGAADILLTAQSAEELAMMAGWLWERQISQRILGGGSNVLVADDGVRGVVILNHARGVEFDEQSLAVRAESGAGLGVVARRAAERGLGGLEWAASVPGTIGGAVVGNAGAHGGDVAGCLGMAEILQLGRRVEQWSPERLAYGYRDSWLKRHPGEAVVLSATFQLLRGEKDMVKARMSEISNRRQQTQPPGASWGSMFKNPPGDHAGRLIDAAGLKGRRIGNVQISETHANFFLNLGAARAVDVGKLIVETREQVWRQFGIALELEVQLVGDWSTMVDLQALKGDER